MRHFLKSLAALAAAVTFATPAAAIDADFTGFLQVRGLAYDNLDGNDDVDDNVRGVDQRFRLYTLTALNENVKSVFAIEVDNVWGRVDDPSNSLTNGGKQVGAIGADAKGQIEIKHAYLDFNIPSLNTNIKAGTQPWTFGRGILLDDDAAGLLARYAVSETQNLGLFWVKTQEGSPADDSADGDYYGAQYDMTFGDWHVGPFAGYWDLPESDEQYYLGADLDGKMGPIGLAATVIFNDGEVNGRDNGSVAAWAQANYKLDATTFSLEGGYMGDEDVPGGTFATIGAWVNPSEVVTGGIFDARGTIGSAAGDGTIPNLAYVKAGAEYQLNEGANVSAYYLYIKEAADVKVAIEDVIAQHDAITFGHEIDAYYNQEVVKGLTWTVGGGYLFADNEYGSIFVDAAPNAGDDAWKFGTMLTYVY